MGTRKPSSSGSTSRVTTNVINGSPKSYATLSALQTAMPTPTVDQASYVYLVLTDGKLYSWNGSAWTAGGVYQATGLITTLKPESKNLFDLSAITVGKEVYSDGTFHTEANSAISDYMLVQGLASIYVSGLTTYASGISRNLYFYDVNKAVIGSVASITQSLAEKGFVVPSTACYCVFSVYQRKTSGETINLNTIQVESGISKTTYTSYVGGISKINGVALDIPLIFVPLKNMFDLGKVTVGKEVYSDGTFHTEANSAISDYIPVQGLSNIYVSGLTPYTAGIARNYFFYDNNKAPIGSAANIPPSWVEASIAVPSNAYYFVFSPYQRKTSGETVTLNTIQVESGMVKTAYGAYTLVVNGINGYGINLPTVTKLKTAGKTLLGFGDSITATATLSDDGTTYTEGTRSNWPTFSKGTLQLGGLWNYACSGAHYCDDVGLTAQQKISTQITNAIANSRPADIIVVAAGTNYLGVLGDYNTAMSKTTLASLDRTNLYEAIRWAFWTLKLNYPNAVCFAATPIQRADFEQDAGMILAIKQMANRYNFIVIDALNESGIVRDFEVSGGAGRYLYDSLHPAVNGQMLMSKLFNRAILNALNDAS